MRGGQRAGAGGTAAGAAKATAARLAKLRAAQSAPAEGVKVLTSGVDTLHLHTVCPLSDAWVQRLGKAKQAALAARDANEASDGVPVVVAGHRFTVRPWGSRKGPLLLECEALTLVINPEAPRRLPTVSAELKALWLWQVGYTTAAADVAAIFAALCDESKAPAGADLRVQVTRLDICADFVGWCPAPEQLPEFFTRAVRRSTHEEHRDSLDTHHRGRAFTGFSWGLGGAISARLYDKTREVKTSNKLWFRQLWRKKGWDGEAPVWRLEFQLRREALNEHAAVDMKSGELVHVFAQWESARDSLTALWRQLATGWLSWRLPRTATQRVRLQPVWQRLVDGAVFRDDSWDAEVYRHKREIDFDDTMAQLGGWLSRAVFERWREYGQPSGRPELLEELLRTCREADEQRKRRKKGDGVLSRAQEKFTHWEQERRLFRDPGYTRLELH